MSRKRTHKHPCHPDPTAVVSRTHGVRRTLLATGIVAISLGVAGCKTVSMPPSQSSIPGMPSPSGSSSIPSGSSPSIPGGQPSQPSAPGTPGSGGAQSPGSPGSQSGGQTSGSGGASGGSAPPLIPGGAPLPIPGSPGGVPGGVPSDDGTAGQNGSSSDGDGDGRWETSNEIPPPPDERGQPGDGDDSGSTGNGEFEEALGDFDGAIAQEREGAAARSPGLPGMESGGSTAGGGAGSDSSEGDDGEPGQTSGFPTGGEIANAPAPPGRSGPSDIDTADARDDDIIARQLREAAMAETDPELKEALWEEYQRYKNN